MVFSISRAREYNSLRRVVQEIAWFRSCNETRSGRRWKSTDTARLPYDNVKMQRSEIERMRRTWSTMLAQSNNLDHLYFNYHAVHTNMLDGVFVLEPTARITFCNTM